LGGATPDAEAEAGPAWALGTEGEEKRPGDVRRLGPWPGAAGRL
jgi:hypothetical protein